MFDPSISLGSVLTIGMFIVTITAYIVSNASSTKVLDVRLQIIDAQLEDFKVEMKKLAEVIIMQARQDIRLDRIEERELAEGKRIDEMEKRLAFLERASR